MSIQHHNYVFILVVLLVEMTNSSAYCGWPVHFASRCSLNEYADQSYDEWHAIAHSMVSPLQSLQLLGIVFAEQGHVNVDGHG